MFSTAPAIDVPGLQPGMAAVHQTRLTYSEFDFPRAQAVTNPSPMMMQRPGLAAYDVSVSSIVAGPWQDLTGGPSPVAPPFRYFSHPDGRAAISLPITRPAWVSGPALDIALFEQLMTLPMVAEVRDAEDAAEIGRALTIALESASRNHWIRWHYYAAVHHSFFHDFLPKHRTSEARRRFKPMTVVGVHVYCTASLDNRLTIDPLGDKPIRVRVIAKAQRPRSLMYSYLVYYPGSPDGTRGFVGWIAGRSRPRLGRFDVRPAMAITPRRGRVG